MAGMQPLDGHYRAELCATLSHGDFSDLHLHLANCPESALFPRYGDLWIGVLHKLREKVEKKKGELKYCHDSFSSRRHADPEVDNGQPTYEDLERIGTELMECLFTYSKALRLFTKIAAMADPSKYHYGDFHRAVAKCNPDVKLPEVYGSYKGQIDRDLCAAKDIPCMDPFSSIILLQILPWLSENKIFKRFFKRFFTNKSTQALEAKAGTVQKVTHVITCAIVPLFLAGSIVALYFVKSMVARLAIIVAVLEICSFSSMFLAGSSREQMTILTSAFAAVLVVFVSGNISCH